MSKKSVSYERLYALPEKVFAEVRGKIEGYAGGGEIADWLQAEGHCTDVTRETLMRQINRFRRQVVAREKLDLVQASLFAPRGTSASKALRLLDVAAELGGLAAIQKERLDKALDLEDQTPLLQAMASDAIKDYRTILERLNTVYMDLGLTPRAKAGVAFKANLPGGKSMEFAWVEGLDERYGEAMRELEALIKPVAEDVFDTEPS